MSICISEFLLTVGEWVKLHNKPQYLYISTLFCTRLHFPLLVHEVQWAICHITTQKQVSSPGEHTFFTGFDSRKDRTLVICEIKDILCCKFLKRIQNFKVIKPTKVSAEASCVQLFRKILYYQFSRFTSFGSQNRVYTIGWQPQILLETILSLTVVERLRPWSSWIQGARNSRISFEAREQHHYQIFST